MKPIKVFAGSLLLVSLCACKDNNQQTTFGISSNTPNSTIYVANVGNTVSQTYSVVVNNPGTFNTGGPNFTIAASVPADYAVTGNNCQNVTMAKLAR